MSEASREFAACRLARSLDAQIRSHPTESGIVELRDAHDAFAARAHLIDLAERTLDLQYYIWRNDMSGTLLLAAVRRARRSGRSCTPAAR